MKSAAAWPWLPGSARSNESKSDEKVRAARDYLARVPA